MCKSGIYQIVNTESNKVYIGQSVDVKTRIRSHKTQLKNSRHSNELLQRSYNKYGILKFEFNIIEFCELDRLDEREVYWISHFNSTNRKFGYNFESGGNFNKTIHEETKEKIRMINRGINNILSEDEVKEIKFSLVSGVSLTDLCEKFNVSISTISKIKRCNNWDWVSSELNSMLLNMDLEKKEEAENNIQELFERGYSGDEIEMMTDYSGSKVKSVLKGQATLKVKSRYESINEDYKNGMTKKEIMKKYGVNAIVFEKAIPNVHTNERQEIHNKILKLYNSGMKNVEIAKEMGIHRTTVTEHIKGRVSITKKQTNLTKELKQQIIKLHKEGLSRRKTPSGSFSLSLRDNTTLILFESGFPLL